MVMRVGSVYLLLDKDKLFARPLFFDNCTSRCDITQQIKFIKYNSLNACQFNDEIPHN